MQHLDAERLAALDDDELTVEEAAHLAVCGLCHRERAAHERLYALSIASTVASTVADDARLTSWPALSAELRAAGLIQRPSEDAFDDTAARDSSRIVPLSVTGAQISQGGAAPSRGGATRRMPGWLRSAAAIALVAGGVALGRVSAGVSVLSDSVVETALSPVSDDAFASVDEASRVLDRAQRDYERASLWLASHDTTVNAHTVYRARLAALDQMMAASRAALYEAPQDPVLNQYYLAAYTAREATLRQLGASLSVDRVIKRF